MPVGLALREVMEERGFDANTLARRLMVHRRTILAILDGRERVTPWYAAGLEQVFGIPRSYWLECQRFSNEEGKV